MSVRSKITAVGIAVCALALPAAALAGLPRLSTTLIVPNKQLGPIVLRESYAAAIRATGNAKAGHCRPAYGCSWGTTAQGTFGFTMATTTTIRTPFAIVASITAGEKFVHHGTTYTTVYLFTGPLAKLRTAQGIGFGSTTRQVRRAYPRGIYTKLQAQVASVTLIGSGPAARQPSTTFTLIDGRVTNITMEALPVG